MKKFILMSILCLNMTHIGLSGDDDPVEVTMKTSEWNLLKEILKSQVPFGRVLELVQNEAEWRELQDETKRMKKAQEEEPLVFGILVEETEEERLRREQEEEENNILGLGPF